jgi:hypothetical protein
MRRHQLIARARNALLGALAFQILLTEKEVAWAFCVLLTPPALLLVSLIVWRNRLVRSIRRAAVAVEFYEGRLAHLMDCWAGKGEPGTQYIVEGHPCAADLDLFGAGSLFELLSTPSTRWGRDTLAAWLCSPANAGEVVARQVAVGELRGQLDLREELAVLAGEVLETKTIDALTSWSDRDPPALTPWKRRTSLALSCLCVSTFLLWCCSALGPLPFLAALLLERAFARVLRRELRHDFAAELSGQGLKALAALLGRLERVSFSCDWLRRVRAELVNGGRPSSHCLRRLHLLLALAPFASLLLGGSSLVLAVEHWGRGRGRAIGRWLAALGECEAVGTLAAHAYENPDDPFPQIVPDGPCFDAEGLGHPLLPCGRCVRNDVRLGVDVRVLIVSGSNMSGKSTFLRTVGINAVLAFAGAPVRARRLRIAPLTVGGTLRVQDSLQAGRSRFYAEVLRVRQLLDLARQRPPLLFLLDELFQGTNSHDRRVGAGVVVRMLLDSGAIGLVTTHDLALTDIADHLAPRASNVHFEDRYENGAMIFDYCLRPGVVQNGNGLALMRAVGIEVW